MRTAEKDVDERPPPSGNPETLDGQLQLVQAQRAWLGDGNRWSYHHLIVVLFFRSGDKTSFTFTRLDHFSPTGEDSVHIVGTATEHKHLPNVKKPYYGIVRIESRVKRKQILDN